MAQWRSDGKHGGVPTKQGRPALNCRYCDSGNLSRGIIRPNLKRAWHCNDCKRGFIENYETRSAGNHNRAGYCNAFVTNSLLQLPVARGCPEFDRFHRCIKQQHDKSTEACECLCGYAWLLQIDYAAPLSLKTVECPRCGHGSDYWDEGSTHRNKLKANKCLNCGSEFVVEHQHPCTYMRSYHACASPLFVGEVSDSENCKWWRVGHKCRLKHGHDDVARPCGHTVTHECFCGRQWCFVTVNAQSVEMPPIGYVREDVDRMRYRGGKLPKHLPETVKQRLIAERDKRDP